ncbi:MAG TPA: ISAs1 family transposase [Thermomicrobiales bacterium]|nr:ISAs1 family transposase [Thermomicrobiales bacterium]
MLIAIDGKLARRSHDRGADLPPIDLVSAWATDARLVLGQVAVDVQSNESTAVMALLDVTGAVVTLDAMHCHHATAAAIRAGDADVLALNGNQPATYDAVETFFAEAVREAWRGVPHARLVTEDAGHGRLETRCYWTTTDLDLLAYLNPAEITWPDLACVGLVERERTADGHTSRETRY